MNIDTMTEREMDVAVAEHVMGHDVLGGVTQHTKSGDTWETRENCYICATGTKVIDLPHYTTDANATREMEAEIQRRGLWLEYTYALLGYDNIEEMNTEDLWKVITATPADRCRAALRVVLGRDTI